MKTGRPAKNLVGIRFYKLVVTSQYKQNNITCCDCICDCGNTIKSVQSRNLLAERIKSCGCLQHRKGKESHKWKGYKDITGTTYYRISREAKRRNLKFEINVEDLHNLFQKQNGMCALTGIPITLPRLNKEERSCKFTASLDRINSDLGYTVSNIQWVHKSINYIKRDLPENYFIKLCSLVANHSKSPSNTTNLTPDFSKIHLDE